MTFFSESELAALTWQAYERAIERMLTLRGCTGVRLVGQSNDKGADVVAHRNGKRWLVQVKHQRAKVGAGVVDRTIDAMRTYGADVPIIVASNGFERRVENAKEALQHEGIPLQLWDNSDVARMISQIPEDEAACPVSLRNYQIDAITALEERWQDRGNPRAMVVLATGLGKTSVAAEWIRRTRVRVPRLRVLSIAHTVPLVNQLERSFWPFISSCDQTLVWTGSDKPSKTMLERCPLVFATLDSASAAAEDGSLADFDVLLIDECHHVGPLKYRRLIDGMNAGKPNGTFLVGLTATPWRPDEVDLEKFFGPPLISIDIVQGLKQGFLAQVDYRMYTDNIDWDALATSQEGVTTPKKINRRLFIDEWDDAVIEAIRDTWNEIENPRCIVFCGTIDHAVRTRDRINGLGFAVADTIHSSTKKYSMEPYERHLALAKFAAGETQVICAVDIFNEGLDVPDVNLVVFQRVTHSRRIFIQQLGRGLRIREGKDKVIVLDFVSDIRRFAAGIELKDNLGSHTDQPDRRIKINSKVTFRNASGDDQGTEVFLRNWLEDVAAIEGSDDDASVLKFPPAISNR